jgi:hypothetical protein
MILLKGVIGGVAAVLVTWTIVIAMHFSKVRSSQGLTASAGGWNYLLQQPLVILLLSTAFAAGMFLTVRFISRMQG